jgi:hypothetical protein
MFFRTIEKLLWKAYLLKDAILRKRVFDELAGIAKSLEKDIFPKLQAEGFAEASFDITESGLKIDPSGHVIPASKDMLDFFRELGIFRVDMDVILEYNQIVDIFRDVWAMKTASPVLTEGYKAYCAVTRFFPGKMVLSIKYNYCELDYSKAIRSIKEKGGTKDHRLFFQKAPIYGIVSGILVMFLGFIAPHLPIWLTVLLSVIAGIIAGIIVFLFLQTLGSLEYDKEYLERRLREKE